jgi:hypothetical protein
MYERIEARRANAGAHHANLKLGQRLSICDRQRFLYANMASKITHSNARACLLVETKDRQICIKTHTKASPEYTHNLNPNYP